MCCLKELKVSESPKIKLWRYILYAGKGKIYEGVNKNSSIGVDCDIDFGQCLLLTGRGKGYLFCW